MDTLGDGGRVRRYRQQGSEELSTPRLRAVFHSDAAELIESHVDRRTRGQGRMMPEEELETDERNQGTGLREGRTGLVLEQVE